jgi:DNA-binding LytR/AlgR family response regulator
MKTNTIHIGGRKSICPDEVMLLEANENYTVLYLENGKKILVATTLKTLEQRFIICQKFIRTHRSHIINIEFISDYQSDNNKIMMQNKKMILISRRRKNAFRLKIDADKHL